MDLVVQKREILGKKTNTLRRDNIIPGELYGKGIENIHISVNKKDFLKCLKSAGESSLVNVLIGGKTGEKRPVFINNVQKDYLTDEVVSIDFYQVNMKEKISVSVPLTFIGFAPAVKDGGILVKAMQEIELEALPANIPQEIKVDVSKMAKFGDSIYVKDLAFPKDVKVQVGLDNPVCTVQEKAAEEEIPTEAPSLDSIKVETEEKKLERDAKKEVKAEAGKPADAKKAPEAKKGK